MSRFITAFRTSSKTQSKLSQLPQQPPTNTNSKGYRLRPKPQQLPFEFVFIPELYNLPSTYQYQFATRSESHPELAFPTTTPQSPLAITSLVTSTSPIIQSQPDDVNNNSLNDSDSNVVSVDDQTESGKDKPILTKTYSASSNHSNSSTNLKQSTPTLSVSSNQPNQPLLIASSTTPTSPSFQTPTSDPQLSSNQILSANQDILNLSLSTTITNSASKQTTITSQPKESKKASTETSVGKITSTYSGLKEKLLYFRDQESKLLQQAGAHSSVAQSEDRKTIALSQIVHRVRQTRKLLLSRISQPRWEIPHHYHTTALEHSLGRKQPNVMEVGELINGHLRIYAIARRTTLSQKILIYALNRAKKAKNANQDRIKSITIRLKEFRSKIKELEELVVQLRQKGVELLNAIASIYYNAYYTNSDYLSQFEENQIPANPITPKAIVLNNGQITTNLQQFISNIPYVQDKQRQELLKLAQLFSVDILTTSSSQTGAGDIRSRFLKSLHIAPGTSTNDSTTENVELQLSQEDKNLVHDILRSVRDEMTSQSYSPQVNHHDHVPTFAKDMVVGEAKLIMFPSSSTSIAMNTSNNENNISGKGIDGQQSSSHSPTGTMLLPIGIGSSPPSSPVPGSPGSNTQSLSITPPRSQNLPLSLLTQQTSSGGTADTNIGSTPPSPTFDPVTGETLSSLQLSPFPKKINFTTVDVLPQPSLHSDNNDDDYESNLLSTGATTDREASILNAKQSHDHQDNFQSQSLSQQSTENSPSTQQPSSSTNSTNSTSLLSDPNINNIDEAIQSTTQPPASSSSSAASSSPLPPSFSSSSSPSSSLSSSLLLSTSTSTATSTSKPLSATSTSEPLLSSSLPPLSSTSSPLSSTPNGNNVSTSNAETTNISEVTISSPTTKEDGKQGGDVSNEAEIGLLSRSVSDLLSLSFDPSFHADIISKALKKQQQIVQEKQQQQQHQQQQQQQQPEQQQITTPRLFFHDETANNSVKNDLDTNTPNTSPPPAPLNQSSLQTSQSPSQLQFTLKSRGHSQPKYKSNAPTSLYQVSSKTNTATSTSTSTSIFDSHHNYTSSSNNNNMDTSTPPFPTSATPPQPSLLTSHTPPNPSHSYFSSQLSTTSSTGSGSHPTYQQPLQQPQTELNVVKQGNASSTSPFNPAPTPGISVFGGGGTSLTRKPLMSSTITMASSSTVQPLLSLPSTTTNPSTLAPVHLAQPSSHQLSSSTLVSTNQSSLASLSNPSTQTPSGSKFQPNTKPVVVRYGGLGSSTKVLTPPAIISVSTTSTLAPSPNLQPQPVQPQPVQPQPVQPQSPQQSQSLNQSQ